MTEVQVAAMRTEVQEVTMTDREAVTTTGQGEVMMTGREAVTMIGPVEGVMMIETEGKITVIFY